MTPQELRARTQGFSRAIVRFCTPLLDDNSAKDTARQLLRSGTAVHANYRSAQHGRSHDEFTAKIGQALDDASEAHDWLELLRDGHQIRHSDALRWLLDESEQLTRIFAASFRTARLEQVRLRKERQSRRKRPNR